LTARGDAMDRVVGPEMAPHCLLAVRAARAAGPPRAIRPARRRGAARRAALRPAADPGALEWSAPRALTSYQPALLLVLAQHAGRVMSREAIMDLIKPAAGSSTA
jgi:hypothetical protein